MTAESTNARIGAIVLCGGKSRRMGFDKWRLPAGDQTLIAYLVDRILPEVDEIVLAAATKDSPDLILPKTSLVFDRSPDHGPLEGIRMGLKFLDGRCDLAYVTACDTPYFDRDVFHWLQHSLRERDAVMLSNRDRIYAMNGIYRTRIHPVISRLIADGMRRVSDLATALDCELLSTESLASIDPDGLFLRNLNRREDYFAFLQSKGWTCNGEIAQILADANGFRPTDN